MRILLPKRLRADAFCGNLFHTADFLSRKFVTNCCVSEFMFNSRCIAASTECAREFRIAWWACAFNLPVGCQERDDVMAMRRWNDRPTPALHILVRKGMSRARTFQSSRNVLSSLGAGKGSGNVFSQGFRQ